MLFFKLKAPLTCPWFALQRGHSPPGQAGRPGTACSSCPYG